MSKAYDSTEELKELKDYIKREELTPCEGCKTRLGDIKENMKKINEMRCNFCIFFLIEVFENYNLVY